MKPIKHYLITITIPGGHMHGYLMTREKQDTMHIVDVMYNEMKKLGLEPERDPLMNVVLLTTLHNAKGEVDGVDVVRGVLDKNEEAKHTYRQAKNFHVSVFTMSEDSPDDKLLMELH